jgi:oxalate decarboxylase/phosphoglucose isomerase-like protein (cupin superfamily)
MHYYQTAGTISTAVIHVSINPGRTPFDCVKVQCATYPIVLKLLPTSGSKLPICPAGFNDPCRAYRAQGGTLKNT